VDFTQNVKAESGPRQEKPNRSHGPGLALGRLPVQIVKLLAGPLGFLASQSAKPAPTLISCEDGGVLVVPPGQLLRTDKLLHEALELPNICFFANTSCRLPEFFASLRALRV
jgi:hypothetical protein